VAEELTLLLSSVVRESFRDSPTPDGVDPIKIVVTRDEERWVIDPSKFDMFTFRDGDELVVIPPEEAAKLPTTWGTSSSLLKLETRSGFLPGRRSFVSRVLQHSSELTQVMDDLVFEKVGEK